MGSDRYKRWVVVQRDSLLKLDYNCIPAWVGQTISCLADKRGRLLAGAGTRGCFSKAEAPVRQPKDNVRPSATPYVGLPKGQTCVRTGLPLIILGRESRIVRYNRRIAQAHIKGRENTSGRNVGLGAQYTYI